MAHNVSPQLTLAFGRRLRRARLTANLTQDMLAERSEVGQDTISRYERGHALPSMATLCRLTQALDVPVTYFFPEEHLSQLTDEQRDAFHLLDTLSPLALDYVVIFVQHVAIMQQQRRFLDSEAFGADITDEADRQRRMLAHDMAALEAELALQGVDSPHVSVNALVAFTALALLGMELHVDTLAHSRMSRRFAQQVRTVRGA